MRALRGSTRELDIDVFCVLDSGLISKAVLDTHMNTKDSTTIKLQPPQLIFLLDDLTQKLQHSLPTSTSKRRTFLKTKVNKNIGFSQLEQYSSLQVAEKGIKYLPAICEHFESTNDYYKSLIEENDGINDGPGCDSAEHHQMASVFQLLLQAISSILSWSGFEIPENKPLLRQAVSILAQRLETTELNQLSFKAVIKKAFEYLLTYAATVPTVTSAVLLVKLFVLLAKRSESSQLKSSIANLTEAMLKREWLSADGEKEKGAKYNESLQVLFKTHLCYSDDKLVVMENVLATGVKELLEANKNGSSNTYQTLTRSSFIVFYRASLIELIDCAQAISPGSSTDAPEVKTNKLLQWNLAVRIFHILVNLIKAFEQRTNLTAILKYGRQFLDIFLRQGMPVLDYSFRHHREDVTSLLKNLQLSTRSLHHMCGHSKIIKDISLTNQVPLLKKCLESFVYRVKAMLTMNKCLEAFWLGNLKNRDLQGEEILSQASQSTTAEPEDSDNEELPDDDEDEESDVDVDEKSNDSASDKTKHEGSYSECY